MNADFPSDHGARRIAVNLRRLNCRVRCFQQLDRVAQFGGALVKLTRNRDFHLALHDLEL